MQNPGKYLKRSLNSILQKIFWNFIELFQIERGASIVWQEVNINSKDPDRSCKILEFSEERLDRISRIL